MSHTEWGMVEGQEGQIGRDPRQMTEAELNALGHSKRPLLRVIRENCVHCAGSDAEVRRCRIATCPMWPYRMATNPFREKQGDERREASRERLAAIRLRQAGTKENNRAGEEETA